MFLWSSAPRVAAQTVEIVPPEIDLGSVPVGETRAFEASLRNNSDFPVRIARLSSSCGCTHVRAAKLALAPGESTDLKGTVRVGGNASTFQHHVLIATASPHVHQLQCTIIGRTRRRLVFSPEEAVLRPDIISNASGSLDITIRNESDHTIGLSVRETVPAGVSLGWKERELPPQSAAELPISVDTASVVPQRFDLTIHTTDPAEHELRIPVEIQPAVAVVLTPSAIPFGVLSSREFRTLNEVIIDVRGKVLAASEMETVSAPAWLRVVNESGVRSASGDALEFSFAIQHALAPTELEGKLDFVFRHRPTDRVFHAWLAITGFLLDPSNNADEGK